MSRPGDKPRRFPASLHHVAPTARPADQVVRPQRLLHEAAQEARRQQAAPSAGLGLDTAAVRQRMIQRLRADGVACEPVLAAMMAVPRHGFVDSALAAQAYEDTSLPIGLGQTISKPSVVARMLEWLFLGASARHTGHLGRVLEIGTGCGYQTAVLTHLATQVVSIERLGPLHELARRHLHQLGVLGASGLHGLPAAAPVGCTLLYGDGMIGHAAAAPYDSIVSAAGGDEVPRAWLEQLAVGGRLVAPARAPSGRGQVLVVVDRTEDGWRHMLGEVVQFVPLKSGIS